MSTSGVQATETRVPIYSEPGAIPWDYTRTETIADLTVHVIGLCLGFAASAVLLTRVAAHGGFRDVVATSVYITGLLLMLTLSAAYNLWPVCPAKWRLRRFDHSAIYVLIAATYTFFALNLRANALPLLVGVWSVAALGIAVKLVWPGRLDRLSIGVYVALGWSAFILRKSKAAMIPPEASHLLLAGGTILTVGVIFHIWRNLRFQNAIWHLLVLVGVTCHYAAVLDVVLN
ncbi:hemolysin III family protein [Bradyrhizobium sp. ORS 111]|uniref:PAQR family membrane homeostasis protein TrhA n=1 Tax=Bradyrhizobium sp. ORS 111 TaxID=1685958 RepID=UPI00388F0E96